VDTRGVVVT